MRLGRVAGVEVKADVSVVLIVWLITSMLAGAWGWPVAVVTAAAFFACLLAHELAHAIVANGRGLHVVDITLWMLGGVTRIEGEQTDPRDELVMAAAGPATSAVLGAVFLVASPAGEAVRYLGEINLVLAVFNLLPAFPLDGGRVLRALLWRRWDDRRRATLRAAGVGRALGGSLIVLGGLAFAGGLVANGIWWALIGWFIVSAARQEAERVTMDSGAEQQTG